MPDPRQPPPPELPLVSVAMATLDGAPFLREQLASIEAQSWANLEIVVSDDGSTDGTIDILREHAERGRLRFEVAEQRRGLVRNFERALQLCNGELIALCDQDDVWKPHRIATLVRSLGDASLVYCNTEEQLDPAGNAYFEPRFAQAQEFSRRRGNGRPTKYLLAENWVVSHSVLFRRRLLDVALPIPAGQRFHDAWIALVAAVDGGIRYVDVHLQLYRNHPASLTYRSEGNRSRRRSRLRALLDGELQNEWQALRAAELDRLASVDSRLDLDAGERRFLATLRRYYGSATPPARAAIAGWVAAPYFANRCRSLGDRLTIALRPLVAAMPLGTTGKER